MFDLSAIDASIVAYLSVFFGVSEDSMIFPILRSGALLLAGMFLYFLIKKTFVTTVRNLIIKKKWNFGSYLIKHKLFTNALKIIPVGIVLQSVEFLGNPVVASIVTLVAELAMILIMAKLVMSILDATLDIAQHRKTKMPVKTIIQVIKIVLFIACALSIIAKLTGKDVSTFLSGMMGLSAVFMLLFRDSLLGMVAGFQISANGIMEKGQWIEIPNIKVDGQVEDISLTTITIGNWDNTKTILPANKVLSETVINWDHMYGKGRRIKESLFIDIGTVRFLTPEEIKNLSKINILKPYLDSKSAELIITNGKLNADDPYERVNGRNLTNIGTFRAYVKAYLNNHEMIAKSQTLLVRKRPTTEKGIPMEIYAFSSDTAWVNYEEISASIFDHLYSVVDLFGLKLFQNPTGSDFQKVLEKYE